MKSLFQEAVIQRQMAIKYFILKSNAIYAILMDKDHMYFYVCTRKTVHPDIK